MKVVFLSIVFVIFGLLLSIIMYNNMISKIDVKEHIISDISKYEEFKDYVIVDISGNSEKIYGEGITYRLVLFKEEGEVLKEYIVFYHPKDIDYLEIIR